MAKRFNKLTPIATSVALSLGLTGCFGDDDNNVKVEPVVTVDGVANADFNIAVSGRAVKGTLKNAALSVKTVNANGELIDVAYRSEVTSVEETASATSEAEAKSLAEKAILDASPSLVTGEKGEYTIYLASDFSGPLHITVNTKKDGDDSLVKCDAFVGCGDFSAASDLDINKNDKVDFGEWYKDDLELSVVKLIKTTSSESASARGIQYAEGDAAASFKANVTLFTSAAAAILIADGEISDNTIEDASSKVIRALIGDEALLATLTADISEGGAVDFTDVDGTESIDAGVLTMIQVAASIQAVAAKGDNGSISDVIEQLKNDVKDDNLEASDTFTALKEQSKAAGKILAAVVSGDTEAVKAALIDAGVDEETAEQTAATAQEAKDKAVESGATTEEGLKEDAEKSEKQLDEIGDGEVLENAEKAELYTAEIAQLTSDLTAMETTLTSFETQLSAVTALGDKADKTNQEVVDYFVLATELNESVLGVDEATSKALESLSTEATRLVGATNLLADKDSQYQAIADSAAAQQVIIQGLAPKWAPIVEGSSKELADAEKEVEAQGQVAKAAQAVAASAIENAQAADTAYDQSNTTYNTAKQELDDAIKRINSHSDVDNAEVLLANVKVLNSNVLTAAENYVSSADNAVSKAEAYIVAAQSTDQAEDATAQKALADSLKVDADDNLLDAQVLTSERAEQLSSLDQDLEAARIRVENTRISELAKVGTDKLTNVSVVTREGANAVFNVGEVIFDVVNDIIEDGSFDSGSQSGTSEKYPDWRYSYNTDDLNFVFENTRDGQKVEAEGAFLSSSSSKLIFTWSGNMMSDSGQKVEIAAPSLEACETYAITGNTPNASCLALFFDGRVNDFDDAADVDISKVSSHNIVTFIDGQYGFDGTVSFDITAIDRFGNPSPVFYDDVTQYLEFIVEGVTEQTEFNTTFDVKYDEPTEEIGSMKISLLNYIGYEFDVNLVDESGPLVGKVSILDDNLARIIAGDITEIENGFRINYISNESIDYTNIEVYGDR